MIAAAAPATYVGWLSANRRWTIAVLAAVSLAAALGLATYRSSHSGPLNPMVGQTAGQKLGNGLKAFGDTVASLFDARSPGERVAGALANLKHRRPLPAHERALPKIRRRPPLHREIAATPPPSQVPPAAAPLYNIFNGPPEGGPATTAFSSPPLAGFPGGGGLIVGSPGTPGTPATPIVPPVPGTPSIPGTPPGVPGVPEPATWAMMLIGFSLIGLSTIRHAGKLAINSEPK